MEAGSATLLFWGSLSFALVVAGAFAVPVNRWLIARGKGHAVVHETGIHGGPPVRVVAYVAAAMAVFGAAVLIAEAALVSDAAETRGYSADKEACSSACAGSRARCAASSGWSRRTATASTSSPRSPRSRPPSTRSRWSCSPTTPPTA